MQFALNVRKRAILQKFAVEGRSARTKFQLQSLETVTIEGLEVKALFDSGSTESFIHPRLVEKV